MGSRALKRQEVAPKSVRLVSVEAEEDEARAINARAIPDSLKSRPIVSGSYEIPASQRGDLQDWVMRGCR